MRQPSDWLITGLARVLIRVFFRGIELDGGHLLPRAGPVVLVANHTNGLVDGLLLMATLDRYPRFLGKSTLFQIPPLWPFLKLAGVIPVYRAIDVVAGDGNVSAFATSRDVLAGGGMIAVFPEGISHDELSLQPLKTGAARIALEGAFDDGIDDIAVIAVGLTYDAKARFRSRAVVHVAAPIGVAALVDLYRTDTHAAVRALTQELGAQLSSVSPSFSSWTQAEWCSRLAEILVRARGAALPTEIELGDQVEVASRLAAAQREPDDTALAELGAAFATYERDLDLLGLNDAQVAAGYPVGRFRLAVFCAAAKIVITLPAAVVGVAIHVLPFQIMKELAKRPTNEGIKASVKLLGCFASFLVVYTALGFLVGDTFGAWAGFFAATAAPICGYAAVRLHERLRRVGGLLEGYHTVRQRRKMIDSVMEHRAAVTAAARSVVVGS
jgi:glycerol-3-phosphate O-acyltransferase / dihydroxyacetone phosphate acyltransferase